MPRASAIAWRSAFQGPKSSIACAAAVRRVNLLFTWQRVAEQIAAVYREVLEQRGTAPRGQTLCPPVGAIGLAATGPAVRMDAAK